MNKQLRKLGPEASKTYIKKLENGFFAKYLSGPNILDIGYKGENPAALPIVEQAIGIDLDYPGYDGIRLPFPDNSQDAVHSSHCLEHITNYKAALADWFRVLKIGGFLIIAVPHQLLYEKKSAPPSLWNADHKRFYTPARLLSEIEESLPANHYRIRHLADNDEGFDYSVSANQHSGGCYEIELVIEKIKRPAYSNGLYVPDEVQTLKLKIESLTNIYRKSQYVVPFTIIQKLVHLKSGEDLHISQDTFMEILKHMLVSVAVDEEWYLATYPDIAEAVAAGKLASAKEHFIKNGYFEGRLPSHIQIDPKWYLDTNPDLAESLRSGKINSLEEHFLRFGYLEGRLPFEC